MSRSQDNRRRRQRAARKMREWRLDREWDFLPVTCPHGHTHHMVMTSARVVERVRRQGGARFNVCPSDVPAMHARVTL